MTDIEEQIQEALKSTGVLRSPGDRFPLAAAVMPLVKRAQAEAPREGGSGMKGQIVTAQFEDGLDHEFLCGLEDCECPEHDGPPRPAGTYITVRLDENARVGFWRVQIEKEAGA